MKKFSVLVFLLLSSVMGFSQSYKVSAADPQQFLTDVQALLVGTKQEAAAQVGTNWETAWNSGKISPVQKTKIMALTQQMLAKRLRARPHFENFFGALGSSVNVHNYTGAKLDQLLSVAEQTLQKQDYKVYERFLNSTHQFLSNKALFQGKVNGLQVLGGSFSFEYRQGIADVGTGSSWDDVVPAAPETKTTTKTTSDEDPWDGWGAPKKAPAKPAKGKTTGKKEETKPAPQPEPVFFEEPLPALAGPVLVLDKVDLLFTSPHDSVTIKSATGAVALEGGKYVGKGGKLIWSHMGGQATAEIQNLIFDVSKPGFQAENVILVHPAVLENDIRGNLEYKLTQPRANGEKAFPRFISHTNNAKIKRFGAAIRYVGGMSMAGQTLMSAALDGSPSTIWVSEGGEQKFKASARNYVINDSLITSPEASVALNQGTDSITHPGVKFKYNREAKRLVLVNTEGLFKSTPYFHSYQQVELSTDMATWNLGEKKIDFTILTAKSQVPAQINSKEYYTEARFNQIRNVANFHPLYLAVGYGQQQGSRSFYLADMERDTKVKREILHSALSNLAQGSFLDYDPKTGFVQLRDKAMHYVDASRDKKDFDYIHLNAISASGSNATLDLASGDLIVRGVQKFTFTKDSLVTAEPDSQTVRIQKNRGILFNGRVKSSNFTFRGKEFLFDYDGFFIDLAKIDSTILTTRLKDKDGHEKLVPYRLESRGGQGTAKLYLNRPDNKSGRKKIGSFPALDAISGATVYFNKPEILGGVYDTSVYFSIPPFRIDSMASGKGSTIGFVGTFHSGGIFPPIEMRLSVQPDGALGFKVPVPKAGYQVYGGKGTFTDTLSMDTKGLVGNGSLTYQTATMYSPSFVFFMDSARTEVGTKGDFKAGSVAQGSYPSGNFASYRMAWRPYQDTLQVESKGKELMSMFADRFTYKGMLGFTPSALFGDGVIENKDVAIKSQQFVFKKGLIHGNRASMEVSSTDKSKPALTTYDVFLDFNLDDGYATYAPERKGFASTVFPFAQYKSSLGGGRWDFKKKELTLSAAEADKDDAYFYSMKTGVDSVRFKATGAVYDLSNYTLLASGVPYIPVGDSYLIPDSNQVYIQENSNLKTFQNASLVLDSVQKFHQMARGELHIDNRYGLTGNAEYTFTNSADNTYPITFTSFAWVEPNQGKRDDRKAETVRPFFSATAEVKETDTLFILPGVPYYGKVMLASNQKNLNFDGFAKLLFSGNQNADWFPFKRENLDPDNVRLEIKAPALADGTPLKTGIHINATDGNIYTTFVSKKHYDDDLDVFEVEGLLSFDKEKGEYKLGDEQRAYGTSYTGNVLNFNAQTNEVTYQGTFKLINPVKGFSLMVAGNGSGRIDSSRYALDTFMAFDFDFPSQAIESMAKNVTKNVQGAPEAVNLNSASLPYKLAAFIGDKGVADFQAQTVNGYQPFSKISSKLVHTLVLNDVQLKWSPATNAWYSVGPISLASIDKTDINAKVNGHIEIKRGASGDVVSMYLEPNPYGWYYFSFYEGGLGAVASDASFNGVMSSKSNGRSAGTYTFYPLEQIDKMEFVNYFRKTYLGKGPLQAPAQPVYDTFATAEEEEPSEKRGRKKKKSKNDADEGALPPGYNPPVETATPVEEKRKKEKRKQAEPVEETAPDIPNADPVEEPKKRGKKKKKEDSDYIPDIPPSGS